MTCSAARVLDAEHVAFMSGGAISSAVCARGGANQPSVAKGLAVRCARIGAPASQLAVSIVLGGQLAGVLYVESPEDMRFSYDDEDALVAVATQLGMAIAVLQQAPTFRPTKRRRPTCRRSRNPAWPSCGSIAPTTACSSTTTT